MKRILIVVFILFMLAGCAQQGGNTGSSTEKSPQAILSPEGTRQSETSTPAEQQSPQAGQMAVTSSAVSDGVIAAAYGKNGEPALSPPLEITGAPEGTVCFAVYMDDIDSQPLCGFRWVHWTAVNIKETSIIEDFSRQAGDHAVQGINDNKSTGYWGPAPPDKDHIYVITVYALDKELTLLEGFTKEEFNKAIEGHVLMSAAIEGLYKK